MKAEYGFSKGKRGAAIPQRGKTRISIFIDDTVLAEFRARAQKAGTGYQTMMNEALKTFLAETDRLVTEKVLRQVLRQEILSPRPAALQQPRAEYALGSRPAKLHIPRKKIAALCRKYGVRKLSLFGSAARGELGPESDVDLMVEFDPASKISLWDYPAMQDDFSALFDHRKVDIANPEILRNRFRRKAIVPELKKLYETR